MVLFLYLFNPLLHIDVFSRIFDPLEASNSKQNALFRLKTLFVSEMILKKWLLLLQILDFWEAEICPQVDLNVTCNQRWKAFDFISIHWQVAAIWNQCWWKNQYKMLQ
jgi:hypothetical protein